MSRFVVIGGGHEAGRAGELPAIGNRVHQSIRDELFRESVNPVYGQVLSAVEVVGAVVGQPAEIVGTDCVDPERLGPGIVRAEE